MLDFLVFYTQNLDVETLLDVVFRFRFPELFTVVVAEQKLETPVLASARKSGALAPQQFVGFLKEFQKAMFSDFWRKSNNGRFRTS